MSVNVGEAVASGFGRLATPSGLGFVAAFAVTQFVALSGMMTVFLASLDVSAGYTLPVPSAVAALVALLALLAASAVGVITTRTFAADGGFEVERATHRLPRATLHYAAAGFIVGIAVFVGMFLLVVPGVYAAVTLIFVNVFVAVEDESVLDALGDSASLADGHKWSLFGLFLVLMLLLGLISFVPDAFPATSVARAVAEAVVNGLTSIITIGATVNAYHQLRGSQEDTLARPA